MKLWPFNRKAAPETRQSTQPFTDAIVSAIAAQAGGTAVGSSDSVGALEMAAGAYSRAFAGATVGVRHGEKGAQSCHSRLNCEVAYSTWRERLHD